MIKLKKMFRNYQEMYNKHLLKELMTIKNNNLTIIIYFFTKPYIDTKCKKYINLNIN